MAAAAEAPAALAPLSHPDQCTYTACYCEENVYLLLKQLVTQRQQQPHQQHSSELLAVFISNPNETVPLWFQRASKQPDGFVVWDYHVIALEVPVAAATSSNTTTNGSRSSTSTSQQQQQQQPLLVWDLDLQAPQLQQQQFPCTLQQYAQHALQAATYDLPPHLQRMYRLVPAASLLQHFASDRSHMRRPDGSWCAEPPPYPCITAAAAAAADADGSCTMNLPRYRDMTCDVLQDTISVDVVQHQQQQQQHSGCGAVVAAAGAVPACSTLPCQAAHGLSAASAVGSQRGAGAGSVSNTQPPVAASAAASSGSSNDVVVADNCVNHPPAQSLSAPAVDGGGCEEEHQCQLSSRRVTWSDVVQAAGRSRYGVVVHEHTLLRCLLAGGGGGGDGGHDSLGNEL